MKKILFFAGLVMAAALFGACNNPTQSNSTTTVKFDDGTSAQVDTFIASHYLSHTIQWAIKHENSVGELTLPTDASNFGAKKIALKCKALRTYGRPVEKQGDPDGEVTIVKYEKGVEIIRNGQSWFYDFEHFCKNPDIITIAAAESVMHPGRWEPVHFWIDPDSDMFFYFIYGGTSADANPIIMDREKRRLNKINHLSDIYISSELF